jgi:hypothetical protein
MPLTINGEAIPDELLAQEFEGIKAHYEEAVPKACNQGQWLRPGQNKKSRRSVFAPPARNECAMLVFS